MTPEERLKSLQETFAAGWRQTRELGLGIVVVVGLFAMWGVLRWRHITLEDQVRSLDVILKIVSISAIAVGAGWTYNAFLRQRLASPRLNVTQGVKSVRLPDGRHLLKVEATVSNIGQIQVILRLWRLYAEQILPLTETVKTDDLPKLAYTDQQANWYRVADGNFTGAAFGMLLEPGEVDHAIGNLVIPEGVEVVQVSSYLWVRADGAWIEGVPSVWRSQDIVDLRPGWPMQSIVDLLPAENNQKS